MKTNTPPLQADTFYHIYNRGINREPLFKEQRNYAYFLRKFAKYVSPVADTYAYCLMSNHFHFLIKTRTAEDILRNCQKDGDPEKPRNNGNFLTKETVQEDLQRITVPDAGKDSDPDRGKDGDHEKPRNNGIFLTKETVQEGLQRIAAHKARTPEWHISNQFAIFFRSYSLSINKAYGRTGGLFEEPFRRIPVTTDKYLKHLILYIHYNPQLHGFTKNFSTYRHSSYKGLTGDKATLLKREEVMQLFGDRENFIFCHKEAVFGNKHNFTEDW